MYTSYSTSVYTLHCKTLPEYRTTLNNWYKRITNGIFYPFNLTNVSNRSIRYRESIGSHLWLVAGTKPIISFAVQSFARFCANPGMKPWKAVLRIFCYLHRGINFGVVYRSFLYTTADSKIYNSCHKFRFTNSDNANLQTSVIRYSYSDWGRDPDTRRSISGYLMVMNGWLIGWCCKRQTSVALSIEAEYMALCVAAPVAVWLIELMHNLNFLLISPITIFAGNQATIEFFHYNLHHAKSMHICVTDVVNISFVLLSS